MKALHTITFILVIVGGLNWLLVGLFSWDVGMIFGGQGAIVSRIIYILVGLSAIYMIFGCSCCAKKACCSSCKVGQTPSTAPENPQI